MSLYCLDSMFYVWGILSKATPGQEDKIPQAKAFFQQLERTGADIVLPTPLITELLMGAEGAEYSQIIAILNSRFHIAEFDLISAKRAADIWISKKRAGVIDEIRRDLGQVRNKIKVDTQILAVALTQKVEVLFTNDAGLQKLADGLLITSPLPLLNEQMMMQFPPDGE